MSESFIPQVLPPVQPAVATASEQENSPAQPLGAGNDWMPNDNDLLPSFGAGRARELLIWLANLELRLTPYNEISPA